MSGRYLRFVETCSCGASYEIEARFGWLGDDIEAGVDIRHWRTEHLHVAPDSQPEDANVTTRGNL